jgi:2-(1,2-epoxy-1,2-dihydrophenyl)acetyl-CoA isomerase
MAFKTIAYTTAEGVARIELNRPEALNAWTYQLGEELSEALGSAATDGEVRAVMITGAGRAFSSGADLKQERRRTTEGKADLGGALREIYNPIILAVRTLPKPVIAAVNGPAVGIGCSLALSCDMIVAAESAYFLLAFVKVGLVPDGGASAFLTSRIGLARASELALLGEALPAREALAWGLINRVYPDNALLAESEQLAARLASGPTLAYANAKRALNAYAYPRLAEQLDLESDLQQEQAESDDFGEGVLAFREKRPAAFMGR